MSQAFASSLRPALFTLAVITPLLVGFVRRPDPLFLPLLVLFSVVSYLFFYRAVRQSYLFALIFFSFLFLLLAPAIVTAAGPRSYVFYYALTFLLLVYVHPLSVRHPCLEAGFLACLVTIVAVAIACTGYALQTGVRPGRATLFAIYQTSLEEAAAYVANFTPPETALLWIVLVPLLLLPRVRPLRLAVPTRYHAVILVPAAFALWQTYEASNELRVISTSIQYYTRIQQYRQIAAERKTSYREIQARRTRSGSEAHVIVIGESTNRNHMGLYGYFRDTTPRLSARADDLVVFTDVISSHSHTVAALADALTLADADNRLNYAQGDAYSIIELLRAAGIETWWLSNQNRFSLWDTYVSAFVEATDHVEFVSEHAAAHRMAPHDANLLAPLRRALRAPGNAKVIFIHLKGTHWPYDRRYPRSFAHFRDDLGPATIGALEIPSAIAANLNHYDNAIRYGDHVLDRLIDVLEQEGPAVSSLLFVSDHGESPIAGTGHDSTQFGRGHVEIPMLIWLSRAFREQHGDRLETLAGNRQKRFMTDELEDVILDLSGIAASSLEADRSPFRPEFREFDRLTIARRINYDNYRDPLLNAKRSLRWLRERQPELYAKVWAHRVNSLGKMSEVSGIFVGAELDLVFDPERGVFEVRHPPIADTGLTLRQVLAYLRRQDPMRLWFDLKSVDARDVERIIDQLLDLDREFGLKQRAIVETSFRGDGFGRLSAEGFYVSYYLPTRAIRSALKSDRPEELRAAAAEIARVVESHGARAVSFPIGVYPFVENYLAELTAARNLDYLTWDLALNSSAPGFLKHLAKRDLHDRMKVILVSFDSRFRI